MKVYKNNIVREINQQDLNAYIESGWTQESQEQKIVLRPPKKKSEKTAEIAPEAAIEDLGNDITQGE